MTLFESNFSVSMAKQWNDNEAFDKVSKEEKPQKGILSFENVIEICVNQKGYSVICNCETVTWTPPFCK